jgi:membrane protein DedA with SNARE-associated domain
LLERYREWLRLCPASLERGDRLFARYGAVTVFFARFVFGLRILAGPLAGVLRMPWKKFLMFNFLGALVWVTMIASVGYLFGRHWARLVQNLKRFDIAVAILVLLAAFYFWWRGRREN